MSSRPKQYQIVNGGNGKGVGGGRRDAHTKAVKRWVAPQRWPVSVRFAYGCSLAK